MFIKKKTNIVPKETLLDSTYHLNEVLLLFTDFETTSNNGLECDPIESHFIATNVSGEIVDEIGFIYKTQTTSQLISKIQDPTVRSFYEKNSLLGIYDKSSFVTHTQLDNLLDSWLQNITTSYGYKRVVLCGYVSFLDKQMLQLFHPKTYKKLYYKGLDLACMELYNTFTNKQTCFSVESGFEKILDSKGRVYHRAKDDVHKTLDNYRKLLRQAL